MSYEATRFVSLTDIIMALFTVGEDSLLAIWREGDETAPSPLQVQFKHAQTGQRVVCIPVVMPTLGGTLPGCEEIHGTPAQQYVLDIYGCERWHAARGAVFSLERREAVLNWLRSKIDPWCVSVQAGTVTQPSWGILQDARIIGGEIDATTPLTKHGWLAAGLRLQVTLTQART